VSNPRDPVSEIEPIKETVTDSIFTTVNLQMLMALYAHREFHDLRAREVGVERCSCALCLNDDAAILAALRSAMSRHYSQVAEERETEGARSRLGVHLSMPFSVR
jgi:hypothetical protein